MPKREDILFLCVALAALICGGHYFYSRRINLEQTARLSMARRELEELSHALAPMKENNAAMDQARQKQAELKDILERKAGWSGKFRQFSGALPKGVWLTGMASSRVDGKIRFVLKGQSNSNRLIASFLHNLEQIPRASGVMLNFAERDPVDAEIFRFEMAVPLAAKE